MDAALREEIQKVKETYLPGMRVRLTKMDDPQAPPMGTVGRVINVDDIGTIKVAWDTGGSLGVVLGEDKVEILTREQDLEIDNNRMDYLRELAQKPKLSPAALMGVSKAYFNIAFSPEDVAGSTEKVLAVLNKAGFSQARKNLILDGITEFINDVAAKKEYQELLYEKHLEYASKKLDCPEFNPKTHPPDGKSSKIAR